MKRFLKISTIVLLSVTLAGLLVAVACVFFVTKDATLDESKLMRKDRTVNVLAYDGRAIGVPNAYASFDEIPPALVDAFVAVEDKRFYRHHGLDYRRIAGAMWANLKRKGAKEGASTITCQLVKNTHLSQEKTLKRKLKEAKLALELEKSHSKEEILEMYLNVIYLGGGHYGVKSAAKGYFDKDLDELTTAECAAIAATTVNPTHYSPVRNPQTNQTRRNRILDLMAEQGYISQEEAEKSKNAPLRLADGQRDIYKTYRQNAVEEAARMTGIDANALTEGYTVYTYCDPETQARAQAIFQSNLLADGTDYMLAFASTDGAIRAFCATFDENAAAVRRQIGSTVKPFVYASAIEKDLLLPDSILDDRPQSFGDYTPHNYHDVYYGRITARDALAKSSNVAAVKTLGYAGLDDAFALINRFGIPLHRKDRHLGLALGGLTYGSTIDELTSAYCTLAAGGIRQRAAFVRRVVAPDGTVVYDKPTTAERVISPSTAYLVTDMLCETARTGTAKKLGELSISIAAKTGTVECKGANSDAWCAAYTPQAVCIAWAGNLSMAEDKMTTVSGGGGTTTIVKAMFAPFAPRDFTRPDSVVDLEIDQYSYETAGTVLTASPNVPTKYRKRILAKSTYRAPQSLLFETPPSVEGAFTVEGDEICLTLTPQALCSYQVFYDNGFSTYLIDEIRPTDEKSTAKRYPMGAGWWCIKPILHGKTDVYGAIERVMIV